LDSTRGREQESIRCYIGALPKRIPESSLQRKHTFSHLLLPYTIPHIIDLQAVVLNWDVIRRSVSKVVRISCEWPPGASDAKASPLHRTLSLDVGVKVAGSGTPTFSLSYLQFSLLCF
jgi:hypothetical protein